MTYAATEKITVEFTPMNVTINGETRSLEPDTNLQTLLALLDLEGKRLAVEVNRQIVPRSRLESQMLGEVQILAQVKE